MNSTLSGIVDQANAFEDPYIEPLIVSFRDYVDKLWQQPH